MTGTAALILAAGRSSRMGRFKPLLRFDGRTVLEWTIGCHQQAGVEIVLVVTGCEQQRLTPMLHGLGVHAVYNPDWREGMFSSVCAGLDALSETVKSFYIHPVDIPAVWPGTIEALRKAYEKGGFDIIKPVFEGKSGHPPLIGSNHIQPILDWNGARGLKGYLQTQKDRTMYLETNDPGVVNDLDRPEDVASLKDVLIQSRQEL